jgi:hypothetical protein
MRKETLETEDREALAAQGVEYADHRVDPEDLLAVVDGQLTEFGLEIVLYETDSDQYMWAIKPRS